MTAHPATYLAVKRVMDVVGAGALLLVSLPLQVVVAGLIMAGMGRPVLFRQQRPGLNGKLFELVKFRTMLDVDEAKGLITDEQRLTRLGSTLRSASLDELPTFWNVLKGEMSLVGPRPLLVEYLPLYSPDQARRHETRPGITGLAQVSGRNGLNWDTKLALDVEYVERRSLALDVRILCQTVSRVLRRDGISAEGEATMSRFTGVERSV